MLYRASCLIIFNNIFKHSEILWNRADFKFYISGISWSSLSNLFPSQWFRQLPIGITLLLCCRWKILFTQRLSAKLNPRDQEMLKRYPSSYHFEALEPFDGHMVLHWEWIELLVALVGQVIDSGKLFKCLWEGWKFRKGFYVRSLKISCTTLKKMCQKISRINSFCVLLLSDSFRLCFKCLKKEPFK